MRAEYGLTPLLCSFNIGSHLLIFLSKHLPLLIITPSPFIHSRNCLQMVVPPPGQCGQISQEYHLLLSSFSFSVVISRISLWTSLIMITCCPFVPILFPCPYTSDPTFFLGHTGSNVISSIVIGKQFAYEDEKCIYFVSMLNDSSVLMSSAWGQASDEHWIRKMVLEYGF